METQATYQRTIKFATHKHLLKDQKVPGTDLPYVVHLSNVAMEILNAFIHKADFELDYALMLALLHDTLEDTETTYDELELEFGREVALGVAALTKNGRLPKEEQMNDSLNRIKAMRKEVGAVKLADRITNLQPPPHYWGPEKIRAYRQEAKQILEALSGKNEYLEIRLTDKIIEYRKYF